MPQQQNHKYIFLLFKSSNFQTETENSLITLVNPICPEYRFQWTDQRKVIQSVLANCGSPSISSGNFEKVSYIERCMNKWKHLSFSLFRHFGALLANTIDFKNWPRDPEIYPISSLIFLFLVMGQ